MRKNFRKVMSYLLILSIIFMEENVFASENIIQQEIVSYKEDENQKDTSFIVKYKDNKYRARGLSLMSECSEQSLDDISIVTYDSEKSLEEVKEELDKSNIEYIQPNYVLELASSTGQYEEIAEVTENLQISAEESKKTNIVVGLIDSEIDKENLEIRDYITDKGYSCIDNSDLHNEEVGFEQTHATHLAGIITGKSNAFSSENNIGVSIMPLEVFKGYQARTSDIIEAIKYAKNNGVDIINMSFGCGEENLALKEAIENASDILFVSAAGNFRRNIDEKPVYPAAYNLPNLISVTSINKDGGLSYYSDYGENNVDIAALGKEVESTLPENKRGTLSGTSMATAVVTRGLAILYANEKCKTPEEYKELIINSADKVSSLTGYVGKSAKLNIDNALNGVAKSNIETINYEDEFSISPEVYDESTAWKLFSASKTKAISSGMAHTIALKEDGSVWAWGDNTYGQLGNGTYKSSTYPVRVKGLNSIVRIDAGGYHNFAERRDGKTFSWGRGDKGQTGGSTANKTTPSQLSYDKGYYIAGLTHSIMCYGNYLYGFGDNTSGQLGSGMGASYFLRPTEIKKPDEYYYCDIYSIDTSYNKTFFVTDQADGHGGGNVIWSLKSGLRKLDEGYSTLRMKFAIGKYHDIIYSRDESESNLSIPLAKGNYEYGQFGVNADEWDEEGFYNANNLKAYKELAAGNDFTLGLKSDGTVYSWGKTFYSQAQMSGTLTYSAENKKLPLSNITEMTAGDDFAIFLDSSGNIWGLGKNDKGQLGNGTTNDATTPVKVTEKEINEDKTAVKVAAGYNHYLALKADGTVWAWGRNLDGELGNGTNESVDYPVKVLGLSNVKDIEAGNGYSLALKTDGTVWAWGKNEYGQLGNGTNVNSNVPVQVQIDKAVKAISAGYEHSLLVTEDKLAYAWGRGNYYQLCTRTNTDKNVPTLIEDLTYLSNVAAGYNHSVLLKQDGTVYTCGDNSYNKLGGNRDGSKHRPVAVMTDAMDIAAGKDCTLILNKNGTVYACGNNSVGNLGLDSTITTTDFMAIPGLSSVKEIQAKGNVNIAKNNDDKYYVWGWESINHSFNPPFYGYSNYNENKNINILDYYHISDISVGMDEIIFINNNKVYAEKDDLFFFVPIAWNYKDDMPPENGMGTKDSPYLIYSIEDFYKINNNIDAYYKLMSDLDFGSEAMTPLEMFCGNLDGNNHTIRNFKIKAYYYDCDDIAMFLFLDNATIENLTIENAEILGFTGAGVIAGYVTNSILRNCNVINTSIDCIKGEAGGIVRDIGDGQMINCTFTEADIASVTYTKNIAVNKGQSYKYFLTCNNISDVSAIRYIIEYDANALKPAKIGINAAITNSLGILTDSNITNVSNVNGVLSFQINSSNKNWSGILCPVEFTAKNTGNTQIRVKVGSVV